ncbi:MAG: hypothetical protein C0482_29150 [Gordonia sp.]|nr:hypothetical protein [Gordonia sp. (in: high G+C Gram-positive bacteria)]
MTSFCGPARDRAGQLDPPADACHSVVSATASDGVTAGPLGLNDLAVEDYHLREIQPAHQEAASEDHVSGGRDRKLMLVVLPGVR